MAKWPEVSEHLSELWRQWAAEPGWCVRLGVSDCFMGSVSDTAAQQLLDNINYYISWRHCWGFIRFYAWGSPVSWVVSFAQGRDPSQTRKWSIWVVCFWASQPFLLDLKEEEQHVGIRVLGAEGTARAPCRYLGVKIAAPETDMVLWEHLWKCSWQDSAIRIAWPVWWRDELCLFYLWAGSSSVPIRTAELAVDKGVFFSILGGSQSFAAAEGKGLEA